MSNSFQDKDYVYIQTDCARVKDDSPKSRGTIYYCWVRHDRRHPTEPVTKWLPKQTSRAKIKEAFQHKPEQLDLFSEFS